MDELFQAFSETVNRVFGPPLRTLFHPTNALFDQIPESAAPYVAKAGAVALFVGAMAWVWFVLNPKYVNIDAPGHRPWHDLRWWTVVSMLPHVIVYVWF